jgi:hypothetical protein
MSAFPGPANPIFYAQFNLRGGWKNTLAVAGGYALLLGGAMYLSAHAASARSYTGELQGWMRGLLILQVLMLLIYGSFRVSASVRADLTGKVMESHRLMPSSAFSAVAGYLFGASVQAIALGLVNVGLGLIACGGAAIEPQSWLLANFMLGFFVVMIWIITEQFAFTARGGFVLMLLSIFSSSVSNGSTLVLLPGVSVLTSPLVGNSVFTLKATFDQMSFPFAVSLLSQFVIGAIFFIAAMRKYRRPDAVAFNTVLGLMLLVAWVAISAVGMVRNEEFVQRFPFASQLATSTQFLATIVASMLLAIMPVASAARALSDWTRNGGPTPNDPRRPVPLMLPVVLATVTICVLIAAMPEIRLQNSVTIVAATQTAAVVLAFLLGLGLLFRWIYLAASKGWLVGLIWLVLTWALPMIADAVYHAMLTDPPDGLTRISALSPIGALILIWRSQADPADVLPGVVFQCAMVLLPAMLYAFAMRRRAKFAHGAFEVVHAS